MAYDALTMCAVADELNRTLAGGRINRIYQTSRYNIVLQIHANRQNYRLLMSAHPQHGGVYLTETGSDHPLSPPMFCMLLRKHLEGVRIERVFQKDLERVLIISCNGLDETGMPAERWLIAEIMGKHSNLILANGNSGTVIDSIRRVSHEVSRVREILPGSPYAWPPPQQREDPFTAEWSSFQETIISKPDQDRTWKILLSSYEGFGPLSAKEVAHRAGLDADHRKNWLDTSTLQRLFQSFQSFWSEIANHHFQPTLVIHPQEKRAVAYAPYALAQYPIDWQQTFPDMNALLDEYFTHWAGFDRLEEIRNALLRSVHQHSERIRNKLAAFQESLLEAEKADQLRAWGEIIIANMHQIRKGDLTVTGPDYRTDPEKLITVPLDPQKMPADNAQTYFRRYNKAKKSLEILSKQLVSAQRELDYLESTETSVLNADSPELLQDIRSELQEEGYMKEHRKQKKAKNRIEKPSQPLDLEDTGGYRILIGRNNRQNDLLTMRIARNEDLWLHVKDMPGSHVIVQRLSNADFSDEIIQKAAGLAAHFSRARHAQKVPVDYTYRKHVRKPRGAKPGMVIYDHQKTVFVSPHTPEDKQ